MQLQDIQRALRYLHLRLSSRKQNNWDSGPIQYPDLDLQAGHALESNVSVPQPPVSEVGIVKPQRVTTHTSEF